MTGKVPYSIAACKSLAWQKGSNIEQITRANSRRGSDKTDTFKSWLVMSVLAGLVLGFPVTRLVGEQARSPNFCLQAGANQPVRLITKRANFTEI
ncbi:MAG: hypothetical protein ACNYPE_13265 [Candidatus Azotimanducaceae bacterium WSBS_2022_MAG_OTU7]